MSGGVPRLSACPNCGYSSYQVKKSGFASVSVGKCRECGQVMCAYCCGKNSFWFGYICQSCGSRKKDTIGRIKDPFDPPTLGEDLEDKKFL